MEPKFLKNFVKIFLLVAGISKNPSSRAWEHMYTLAVTWIYVIEVVGNYVGYISYDLDVEQVMEMVFRLIGHTYALLLHWFIKLHKRSVLKLTSVVCGSCEVPDEVGFEAIAITESSFKLIGTVTLSVYSVAMLTYMLMSVVVGIATHLQADDVYIYLFPYWYTCKSTAEYGFMCWNVDGYASYLMKNATQFGFMFVEQFSLFNCVALFVLLLMYFEAHRQVLEERMRCLRGQTDAMFEAYVVSDGSRLGAQRRAEHEVHFNRGVVQFIKYHQFLLRKVFMNAKPLLSGLLSLILCFIWMLMLFTLGSIMVKSNGSFVYKMKAGSLVVMSGVVFYLTCYLGELVGDLNRSFAEFLYDTSWYQLTPKSRKLVEIQLILLQTPYRIKAFGMYLINMERFAFSMRSVYTALNMLLISLRKS